MRSGPTPMALSAAIEKEQPGALTRSRWPDRSTGASPRRPASGWPGAATRTSGTVPTSRKASGAGGAGKPRSPRAVPVSRTSAASSRPAITSANRSSLLMLGRTSTRTSGRRPASLSSTRGTSAAAMVSSAPSRTIWRCPVTSRRACSAWVSRRCAQLTRCSPALVSRMPLAVRWNNATPSDFSSARICSDTLDGAMPKAMAASVTVR
jgi:hypothetical protein